MFPMIPFNQLPVFHPWQYTFKCYIKRAQASQRPLPDADTLKEIRSFRGQERGNISILTGNFAAALILNGTYKASTTALQVYAPDLVVQGGLDDRDVKRHSVNLGVLALSQAIATAIVHPIEVVSTWQIMQGTNSSSLRLTMGNVMDAGRLYQGIEASLVSGLARVGVSYVLRFLLGKRLGLQQVTQEQQDRELAQEGEQRMVVLTCRRLAKNTAINLILDWTADAIVFPLMAIRWRMEAQGSTPDHKAVYSSALQCYQSITDNEGWQGLYKGFSAHVVSLAPNFAALGVIYVFAIVGIELVYSAFNDEELDSDDEDK